MLLRPLGAVGILGALRLWAVHGSLDRRAFRRSPMGGTRLCCMIALLLAGARFVTPAMGCIGSPRHPAEWIAALGPSAFGRVSAPRPPSPRIPAPPPPCP